LTELEKCSDTLGSVPPIKLIRTFTW
jgi:hypothetical protein